MGYIVLDSQFQPFTFEQQIAPYKEYYENAYKQQEALAALETKATALKQIADSHPEWQQEYNDYMNTLINLRDQMYSTGVDQRFIQDSLNASKQFGEMSSMVTADGQKRALTEGLNKLVQQDATAFTSIEGEEPTAYDLRKNPYADQYKTMSGAQLQANVESKAKHYAEQMDYPDFYNTDVGILTEKVSGYTPQEMSTQVALIEHLLSDATFASKTPEEQYFILQQYENAGLNTRLLKFVQDELETSGVSTWTSAAKRKAIHYITNGLWAGVGKNTWDLQKSSSSDGSGGNSVGDNIYMNDPKRVFTGNYVTGFGEGVDVEALKADPNSSYYTLSVDNPVYRNMEVLYDRTDINGDITLDDGSKVNINDAIKLAFSTKMVRSFLNDNWGEWAKGTEGKQYKTSKDKQKNYSDYFYIMDKQHNPGITDIERREYRKKDIEKHFNVKIEDIGQDENQMYIEALFKTNRKDLKPGDIMLKKANEQAWKIKTQANLDLLNIHTYLDDNIVKDIIDNGVHKSYEGNIEFGSHNTTFIPVSGIDQYNAGIVSNLNLQKTSIVYKVDSSGLRIQDTEGITVEKMLSKFKKDKNNNELFTVYLNPEILHYDNYDKIGNNARMKDCFLIQSGEDKYLVPKDILGENYIALMNKAQELYDSGEWQDSKPSTAGDRNTFGVSDDFYSNLEDMVYNIRNQADITPKTSI